MKNCYDVKMMVSASNFVKKDENGKLVYEDTYDLGIITIGFTEENGYNAVMEATKMVCNNPTMFISVRDNVRKVEKEKGEYDFHRSGFLDSWVVVDNCKPYYATLELKKILSVKKRDA